MREFLSQQCNSVIFVSVSLKQNINFSWRNTLKYYTSYQNDPGMHHGTCVTHVPWCMSGWDRHASSKIWNYEVNKKAGWTQHFFTFEFLSYLVYHYLLTAYIKQVNRTYPAAKLHREQMKRKYQMSLGGLHDSRLEGGYWLFFHNISGYSHTSMYIQIHVLRDKCSVMPL